MSEDGLRGHDLSELMNWHKHFDKWLFTHTGYEIPRPCMYQEKPYWRGGFMADYDDRLRYQEERIYDMSCNEITIISYRLYEPTDKEYIKHFMRPIELGLYRISPQKKAIVKNEKTSGKKKAKHRRGE